MHIIHTGSSERALVSIILYSCCCEYVVYIDCIHHNKLWSLSAPGGLSLAVEGPFKAEITCKDNKDGTCTVSYLPTAPGDYSVIVKFDNKHIAGSPFTAKITGETTFTRHSLTL